MYICMYDFLASIYGTCALLYQILFIELLINESAQEAVKAAGYNDSNLIFLICCLKSSLEPALDMQQLGP